jgi:hypothetical protein
VVFRISRQSIGVIMPQKYLIIPLLFEDYKKQSIKHLDLIKTSAWQVGIKLLSIIVRSDSELPIESILSIWQVDVQLDKIARFSRGRGYANDLVRLRVHTR